MVAASIARQIENRISYKRAIKMAIASAIRMNAEGIKVEISGRLNGAEMARNEHFKEGRIPLLLSVQILIMHLLNHILLMAVWV